MAYVKIRSFRRKDEFGNDVEVSFMAEREGGKATWIRVCTYFSFTDNKLKTDYYKNENPKLFESVLKREEKYLKSIKNSETTNFLTSTEDTVDTNPVPEKADSALTPETEIAQESAAEYIVRILNLR